MGSKRYHREVSGPDMQVYAGHGFRRPMLEVCKGPLEKARPFTPDLLDIGFDEGVQGGSHTPITVDIDSWEVYESTALAMCKAAVIKHEEQVYKPLYPNKTVHVNFKDISSRRVLLPGHLVEYSHFGATYRVFINGQTGAAFGLQETILDGLVGTSVGRVKRWLNVYTAAGAVSLLSMPEIAKFALKAAVLALRLLLIPPFALGTVAAIGGYQASLFFGSAKARTRSFEEWEEMKRMEKAAQATMSDTWVFRPQGQTRSDAEYSRQYQHAQSEQEARRQRQAQREQERRRAEQREAEKRRAQEREAASKRASQAKQQPPAVDPSDYYALLGLERVGPRASLEDVQKAFRRELMKYHPDHNQNTGMDLAAASTRTQHILAAYKVLRNKDKRAVYDSTYRRRR